MSSEGPLVLMVYISVFKFFMKREVQKYNVWYAISEVSITFGKYHGAGYFIFSVMPVSRNTPS